MHEAELRVQILCLAIRNKADVVAFRNIGFDVLMEWTGFGCIDNVRERQAGFPFLAMSRTSPKPRVFPELRMDKECCAAQSAESPSPSVPPTLARMHS